MADIKYEVKGANENPKLSTIEKSGHSITFTLEEVEAHEAKIIKLLKEKEGQKSIEDAKMQNVLNYHPEVGEMTAETRRAAFVYEDANIVAIQMAESIEAAKKVLAEYASEKMLIKAILGIKEEIVTEEVKTEVTPDATA